MPCLGVPGDEFDHCLRGRVGMGQRTPCKSFIEAVNHWRWAVSAQRCIGVITAPSHLASRYMRPFATDDLTWQPFPIFKMV